MGLSIVISGAIMMLAIVFVLFSIPGLLGTITSIGDVSSEVSDLENSILETDISLDSLAATSGKASLTFNLNNDDLEKLWNYDYFDVLVTYDADVSGTKTRVTEIIPFGGYLDYSILDEVVSTSADTVVTTSYTLLNDMTSRVTIDGLGSHVLFWGQASFDVDSGGGDASCYLALFIDGSMVAEGIAYVDDDSPEEPGSVTLAWWETGLSSGTHTFELQKKEGQTDCIADTNSERSMQIIEFTSDVPISILGEVKNTGADTTVTSSYEVIGSGGDTMTSTVTVGGTSSVLMISGTVTIECASCDAAAGIGIDVDGTIVAEGMESSDNGNEEGNVSLVWWETGLSSGLHTFELHWKDTKNGTPQISQDVQKHLQIVEFTGPDVPTILDEITSISPDTTATSSYTLINDMTTSPTVAGTGSLLLASGTVTYDSDSGDTDCQTGLHIDSILVSEVHHFVDDDNNEPSSHTVLWADTGLSAGSHTWDMRFKEPSQTGCIVDIEMQRHMQVIEFPCPKEWSIVSITNDLVDPGILNIDEIAQICITLNNPIFSNGIVIVSISTDNGITATISGIVT